MGKIREFFGFGPLSKIEVVKSEANGQYYFRVVSQNHQIVAQSEGYTRKASAFRGIKALKRAVSDSEIVDLTGERII